MDSVYQQAVAKREALMKQREAIDAELDQLASFLDMYGKLASASAPPAKSGRKEAAAKPGRKPYRKAPAPKILAESLQILRHGPQPTRAIFEALRARGLDVKGRDDTIKRVNLSSILGRARDRDGTLKLDQETRCWSLVEKAPKSKGPVDVTASTGPELRGNSSPASA